MKMLTLFFTAAFAATSAAATEAAPVRLHFHVKQGLILVDGRVDSTSGDFMLDTGETYFRFLLNRNYVPLGLGTDLYRMRAASGQTSMIQSHRGNHAVVLAGTFETTAQSGADHDPTRVVSDDFARMQRNVDPRLLGVIGFGFLKHYDFTIDYQKRIVSLYPLGAAPASGITIKFTPQSPIVPFVVTLDGIRVPAYIDTGGWQLLKAPTKIWERLASRGRVVSGSAGGAGCVNILRVRYGLHEFNVPHTEKVTAQEPMLTLSYPFLRRYLSIWKPQQGTVTLVPEDKVHTPPSASCD